MEMSSIADKINYTYTNEMILLIFILINVHYLRKEIYELYISYMLYTFIEIEMKLQHMSWVVLNKFYYFFSTQLDSLLFLHRPTTSSPRYIYLLFTRIHDIPHYHRGREFTPHKILLFLVEASKSVEKKSTSYRLYLYDYR